MGEALIARGQTAMKNVLDDIPVSGDYCSILVKLMDSSGGACENTKINCKDGTRWYNYTTNEAGYVLFKCNSGAANITANNWINGVLTLDQNAIDTLNLDAPVGTKILKEIKFNGVTKFYRDDSGWYNGQFRTTDRICNVIVVGGGGGGSSGQEGQWGGYGTYGGGGGGGGAKNFASYIDISKNQIYNLYIADGGSGGGYFSIRTANNGGTGETSSAFGLSANGGEGGKRYIYSSWQVIASGGVGLYNGGNGGLANAPSNNYNFERPTAGINGAGGGGGGGTVIWYNAKNNQVSVPSAYRWGIGSSNGGGNGGMLRLEMSAANQIADGKGGIKGSGGGGGGGTYGGTWNHSGSSDSRVGWGGWGGSGRVEFECVKF